LLFKLCEKMEKQETVASEDFGKKKDGKIRRKT
jgi:hypothetical protein